MSIQFLCSLKKKKNKTGLFIMSLTKTILFFLYDLDPFIYLFFSCPTALARIIGIMLNKNGQNREYMFVLFLVLGGKKAVIFS